MRTTLLTFLIIALAACDPTATNVTPDERSAYAASALRPKPDENDEDGVELRGASSMRVSGVSAKTAVDADADEGCAKYRYAGYYIAGDTIEVTTRFGKDGESVSSIWISGQTLKAKKVRQIDENRFQFVLQATPNFTAGSKILKFATNKGIFNTRLNVVNRLQYELYGTADYAWRSVGVSHERYFGVLHPFDKSNLVGKLLIMDNGERRLVDSEDAEYYTTVIFGRSCDSPEIPHWEQLRRLPNNVAEHSVGYIE
jgi:hypothetical protein